MYELRCVCESRVADKEWRGVGTLKILKRFVVKLNLNASFVNSEVECGSIRKINEALEATLIFIGY